MWIVKLALNRPYTFIVMALLILIASPVVILRTPTDIFPNINIPVVAAAWTFTGLNPNVTRVRTDQREYFANILRSAHGSVLEHANFSFALRNVSRVATSKACCASIPRRRRGPRRGD